MSNMGAGSSRIAKAAALVRSNPGSTGAFSVGEQIPDHLLTEQQKFDQQQHYQQVHQVQQPSQQSQPSQPSQPEPDTHVEYGNNDALKGMQCSKCGQILTHMNVLIDSSTPTGTDRLCAGCSFGACFLLTFSGCSYLCETLIF
jgi:hypothetical protein